jgi:ribosomal protein L35AE/L33A
MQKSENVKGKIQGRIVAFRTGPRTQKTNEYILNFPGITTPNHAARLIGRKVACAVGKRTIKGKIVGQHGKSGMVRARLRKGLPGLLGTPVEIVG